MVLLQRLLSLAFIGSNLYGFNILADQQVPRAPNKSTRPAVPSLSVRGGSEGSPLSASSSSSSWSSYMTVDPSTILSVLVKKAGFLMDPKIKQMASLLHCDEAKLNVAKKELIITNFTVSVPNSGNLESLKIGRIYVRWDSYSRPCLEIEVEDVDILVEFVNLLFTKNNWDELNDLGFPPEMLYVADSDTTTQTTTAETYEFIRIGSLDLKGKVALHTRSRPLHRPLSENIVIQLAVIRDLNKRIRQLAEQNRVRVKRRGCTSDEIYEIFQTFFNSKAKEAIRLAVEDLAAGKFDPSHDSRVVQGSKRIATSARAALLTYASGVESLSKEKIKERLRIKGEDGDDTSIVSDEELDKLLAGGVDTLKLSIRSLGIKAMGKLDTLRRESANANANPVEVVLEDDEIIFPDW